MLAKPALIGWANKQGLLGIDIRAKRKQWLADGTSMHEQVQHGVFEREIDAAAFANFMLDKTVIASEKEIETEWFVGRLDVQLIADGEEYVCDYKGGFRGTVYLENKLQLIAYTMAVPAKMAIIPTPQFHLFPVSIADRKPYENILIQLSKLYPLLKEVA